MKEDVYCNEDFTARKKAVTRNWLKPIAQNRKVAGNCSRHFCFGKADIPFESQRKYIVKELGK